MLMRFRVVVLVLVLLAAVTTVVYALPDTALTRTDWRSLKNPVAVGSLPGACYYTFPLDNGTKAHLIVADIASANWRIRPAISEKTASTSEIARKMGAIAAVNGGYFNLSDGVSASYVVMNTTEVANPTKNKALTSNPKLQPHLQKIFARSEVRFLKDKTGRRLVQIARHTEPIPTGVTLEDALQAGPALLPCLTSSEEAFVRTEPDGAQSDSIGTTKLAARTAFGITSDGHGLMLTVAGKGQEDGSSGLTLTQLADLMKKLGCSQAINLDGGASTTMYAELGNTKTSPLVGVSVCGKKPETRVKSILMLEQVNK